MFLCGDLKLFPLAGLLYLVRCAVLLHGSRLWYFHLQRLKSQSSWLAVQRSNFLLLAFISGGAAWCVLPQTIWFLLKRLSDSPCLVSCHILNQANAKDEAEGIPSLYLKKTVLSVWLTYLPDFPTRLWGLGKLMKNPKWIGWLGKDERWKVVVLKVSQAGFALKHSLFLKAENTKGNILLLPFYWKVQVRYEMLSSEMPRKPMIKQETELNAFVSQSAF